MNRSIIDSIIEKISLGDRPQEKDVFIKIAEICKDVLKRQYLDKQSVILQKEMISSLQDLLIYAAETAAFKNDKSTITAEEIKELVNYFSESSDILTTNARAFKENLANNIGKNITS